MPEGTRLNKFLANSGICARRKADELIRQGYVKVNGVVVTEMGHRVLEGDAITYKDKPVEGSNKIYILLNKPKDTISTTGDPRNRRTVMDMIESVEGRLYPVGRLDRNTTGLILLTNDGELAQSLSHPSREVKKIYEAQLDKPLSPGDEELLRTGLVLEEGTAVIDDLGFPAPTDRRIVGIELHIGWNRIIRRLFEKLGYKTMRLDRVTYAGLTKKNLPRGKWRHLSEKEVHFLKHSGGKGG